MGGRGRGGFAEHPQWLWRWGGTGDITWLLWQLCVVVCGGARTRCDLLIPQVQAFPFGDVGSCSSGGALGFMGEPWVSVGEP